MPLLNLYNKLVITNGSMAGNLTSSSIDMDSLNNVGFQFTSTGGGAPTGTIALQGSNDNTNFAAITTTPSSPAFSGSDATILVNPAPAYTPYPFRYIRAVYTFTSGTGSLNVTAHANSQG